MLELLNQRYLPAFRASAAITSSVANWRSTQTGRRYRVNNPAPAGIGIVCFACIIAAMYRKLADRLGEPIHLNLLSLLVIAFGGFRAKVEFDLISRRPYAFGVLKAADMFRAFQLSGTLYALEFGVASGDGLISMARIAHRVTRVTGVEIKVVGFDTGTGLPHPRDYRDHPEHFMTGDFAPTDKDQLIRRLPENCSVRYGDISATVDEFLNNLPGVIGFVSVDVDYYWSAKECLRIFSATDAKKYLPVVPVYFDDVLLATMNSACGERLAIAEFNQAHALRRIEPFTGLRHKRIFKNAPYLEKLYSLHVLDHPLRSVDGQPRRETKTLKNRYL